jgi:tRNA pseudouridine38-40 synthase
MRVRAKVAYDGTEFRGFQKQAAARTVQGEIEAALARLCGSPGRVIGAGRTDTGVHASGQVIAFEAEWPHALVKLERALNASLPDDVALRELQECGARFHPRFSALSRAYQYSACVGGVRDPLRRRFAWQLDREIDLAAMNAAAGMLVGQHDFAAFGTAPSGEDDETTVRVLMRAEWRRTGATATFEIEANAFLYRMVRRIVLILVRVGQGRIAPPMVREILESKDAGRIKGLAPACGLCLVDVKY